MRLDWIDVNCIGGSARAYSDVQPTVDEHLATMARLGISRALVRSTWSDQIASQHVNDQLFDDCAGRDAMLPVVEVTPEGGEAFMDRPADAIAHFARRGAGAGVPLLTKNAFVLASWCAGDMLEAMQARRLPLMVWFDAVPAGDLHSLLTDYPKLPVILQGVPRKGYNHVVASLLPRFEQLYVVMDAVHSAHEWLEYLVGRFGAEQLVWGSGYPTVEPGAAIAGITYAGIRDEAKQQIAGGNMARVLAEVCRD